MNEWFDINNGSANYVGQTVIVAWKTNCGRIFYSFAMWGGRAFESIWESEFLIQLQAHNMVKAYKWMPFTEVGEDE